LKNLRIFRSQFLDTYILGVLRKKTYKFTTILKLSLFFIYFIWTLLNGAIHTYYIPNSSQWEPFKGLHVTSHILIYFIFLSSKPYLNPYQSKRQWSFGQHNSFLETSTNNFIQLWIICLSYKEALCGSLWEFVKTFKCFQVNLIT